MFITLSPSICTQAQIIVRTNSQQQLTTVCYYDDRKRLLGILITNQKTLRVRCVHLSPPVLVSSLASLPRIIHIALSLLTPTISFLRFQPLEEHLRSKGATTGGRGSRPPPTFVWYFMYTYAWDPPTFNTWLLWTHPTFNTWLRSCSDHHSLQAYLYT